MTFKKIIDEIEKIQSGKAHVSKKDIRTWEDSLRLVKAYMEKKQSIINNYYFRKSPLKD